MSKRTGLPADGLDQTVRENAVELENFLDVEYEIQVIVGASTLTVGRLLELRVGDTIKLDRPVTDHILLAIDGLAIGEAEVIITKTGTGARLVAIG